MSETDHHEYDDNLVNLLELVWGEGYLSPGGPDEVVKVVEGISLEGKKVLDIGCGTGGIDQLLIERFNAGHVIGIDADRSLVEKSIERAKSKGLNDRLAFQHVEPGRLSFDDNAFDVVFSKDSIIHIPDKLSIAQEVYRVLQPGGFFIASDWMKSEGPVSDQLAHYIELEDLGFGMGSQSQYQEALTESGFTSIQFTNRNEWYREIAKQEHQMFAESEYDRLVELVGKEFTDHEINVWKAMIVVLDRGELRPTHWRAMKPQ